MSEHNPDKSDSPKRSPGQALELGSEVELVDFSGSSSASENSETDSLDSGNSVKSMHSNSEEKSEDSDNPRVKRKRERAQREAEKDREKALLHSAKQSQPQEDITVEYQRRVKTRAESKEPAIELTEKSAPSPPPETAHAAKGAEELDQEKEAIRRSIRDQLFAEEREKLAQEIAEKFKAEVVAKRALASQKRKETKARKKAAREAERESAKPVQHPLFADRAKGRSKGVKSESTPSQITGEPGAAPSQTSEQIKGKEPDRSEVQTRASSPKVLVTVPRVVTATQTAGTSSPAQALVPPRTGHLESKDLQLVKTLLYRLRADKNLRQKLHPHGPPVDPSTQHILSQGPQKAIALAITQYKYSVTVGPARESFHTTTTLGSRTDYQFRIKNYAGLNFPDETFSKSDFSWGQLAALEACSAWLTQAALQVGLFRLVQSKSAAGKYEANVNEFLIILEKAQRTIQQYITLYSTPRTVSHAEISFLSDDQINEITDTLWTGEELLNAVQNLYLDSM